MIRRLIRSVRAWDTAWTHAREAGLDRWRALLAASRPNDRQAFLELGRIPVERGGTLIDVGANRGQFLDRALRRFAPRRAIAFEPLPEAFEELSRRFAGDSRCELRSVALGRENARRSLRVLHHDLASSLLPLRREGLLHFEHRDLSDAGEIEVEVRRLDAELDALAIRKVDLLKLDVQGYELAVLEGLGARVQCIDVLLTEVSFYPLYEGGVLFWGLHRFLERKGFVLRAILGPQTGAHGALLQADAVYRRREEL